MKRQGWLDLTHYGDTVMKAWGWGDVQDPKTFKEHSFAFTPASILFCIFTDTLYLWVFAQIFELATVQLPHNRVLERWYFALKAGLLAGWLTVFWGPKFDLLSAYRSTSNATR